MKHIITGGIASIAISLFMFISHLLMTPKHDYMIELNKDGSVSVFLEYQQLDTTLVDLNQLEEFITKDNI